MYEKLKSAIFNFIALKDETYVTENANKDAKAIPTHRDLLAGILSKHMALDGLFSKEVVDAHTQGLIHIHDLDYAISNLTNCCLVNYPDMLENGFAIGDAKIEKPQSIGVATTVLTQIVQAVASGQYGGQTLAHIDRFLTPYVERSYRKLLEAQTLYNLPDFYVEESIRREVGDAMQTLLYQINSLTTTNGQFAFCTLTLGLETSKWGRMITEEYLKVHLKGLGKDAATPVFPKVVFILQEGINLSPADPNYDLKQLAIKCSSERVYPDYISAPKVQEVTGCYSDVISPMGCRSFLNNWENPESGMEESLGRMNLGVCSINLPLVALKSLNGQSFEDTLDEALELAYKAQMERVERLKQTRAYQNPIMFVHGAIARLSPNTTIEELLYDGRSSISVGYVGLWECVDFLGFGRNKQAAENILKHMKKKLTEFRERSRLAFSIYGSPSESLCYKFARAVEDTYPDTLGRDYLTNSFHVPVWMNMSPIEKWKYEEGFALLSSGGFISYIEQPNLKHNLKAYESFVDYAYNHLPYFAINTPVDRCYECGNTAEFTATSEGFKCPCCGNSNPDTISVIRRVSGYLSAPNARPFNRGKQQEVGERTKHTKEVCSELSQY